MSKRAAILSFFCILLISFNLVFSVAWADEIKKPQVKAQGAILMDKKTGRILWEKNCNEPLAMASTTKIMTAIITLENGNLSDTVKVSKNAVLAPPVKMHLKKDEEISLENLMYALMLQSSNDAAVAIAEHIGGDVDTFCNMMTKKAQELGCKDTVFRTPNGLDSLDHHSTAEDMAVIARYALNNPDFLRIINTKQVSFKTNMQSYDIINKNRLLSEYEGAEGVKTGFTGKAGHCFVGAAKRDDMELISVVLASGWGSSGKNQKWVDTKAVLNYGFNNYKFETLAEKNTKVGTINVLESRTDKIDLYLKYGLELPLRVDEINKISVDYIFPSEKNAPIKKDDVLGKAVIKISDIETYEIPIIAGDSAQIHNFKTSINKIINSWLNTALNCILE